MSLSLIEGEKIFVKTSPHFFSMIHLYLCWIYLGAVGTLFLVFHENISAWLQTLPLPATAWVEILSFALWSLALILPAIFVSFLRVNWGWLFLAIFLSTVGIASYLGRQEIGTAFWSFMQRPWCQQMETTVESHWPSGWKHDFIQLDEIANYWLILVSFLGLCSANSYRRSHRYYITNRRIITRFGFFIMRERDLLYSKIDDLILHQDLLGRIFNFGTLIPISASGIGTGNDQVIWMAGAEQKLPVGPSLKVTIGGGRTITVPRSPSFYALYGVPQSEGLRNIMLKEMEKREYRDPRRETRSL